MHFSLYHSANFHVVPSFHKVLVLLQISFPRNLNGTAAHINCLVTIFYTVYNSSIPTILAPPIFTPVCCLLCVFDYTPTFFMCTTIYLAKIWHCFNILSITCKNSISNSTTQSTQHNLLHHFIILKEPHVSILHNTKTMML